MPTAQHGQYCQHRWDGSTVQLCHGLLPEGPQCAAPGNRGLLPRKESSLAVYVSLLSENGLHFSARTAISIFPLPCPVAFLLLPSSSPIPSPPLPAWITTLTLLMLSSFTGMCHAPHGLPRGFFCTAVLLPVWETWTGTAGATVTTGCWDMASGHSPTWGPSGPCTAAAHNAQPTNGLQHNLWSSASEGEGEKRAVRGG